MLTTGRRFASRKRVRSGLTLVELVIVIMIVGFLMVFVGGILRNLLIPTTEDVSAKLSEAFKFGADKAQLTNQTVVFRYDFDKAEYQFFSLKREEDGIVEESILKKTKLPFYSKILKTRDFSGKVNYQGQFKIQFSPQGNTTDLFIYLGSDSEIKKTMQIFRYSGKIKIFPGEYILEEQRSDRDKISYGLDERDEQVDTNAPSQKTPR
ncbi:prepilin-type N-terminal cleavage/methylation domain-containing protein [Leptospira ognonensis]|uniref:Prepilin-type N-terminal cleavage/methylation domain-containing protein n=1 Tax=Leptospira ognonensis TaxID=2484945 RepID=A0A4V3JQW4_9LEPT|nr:prepilin-type N-terminal cleavage/methylation domain-containing protein [Leptospira ognonensis]